MRKLICIGGLPATGKTTIVKKFLEGKQLKRVEPRKLLVAMYDAEYDLYILGDYSDPNEKFPGLDRLSMAVQPEAIKFLKETQSNILFEGDRLFTASFLEAAVELVDLNKLELKILLLNVNKLLVEERHKNRADTQTEKFLKGRQTKYDNINNSLILMDYITEMTNNNQEELKQIVNWLRLELHDKDDVIELL